MPFDGLPFLHSAITRTLPPCGRASAARKPLVAGRSRRAGRSTGGSCTSSVRLWATISSRITRASSAHPGADKAPSARRATELERGLGAHRVEQLGVADAEHAVLGGEPGQ